jgi:hypothetical protein
MLVVTNGVTWAGLRGSVPFTGGRAMHKRRTVLAGTLAVGLGISALLGG